MYTEFDVPDAISPKLHDNVSLAIEQPVLAGSIDQLTPEPVGNGSLRVTPFAVPWPAFDTVIANPISSPATTTSSSAVLVIVRVGASTTIVADALIDGWFAAAAVAMFG